MTTIAVKLNNTTTIATKILTSNMSKGAKLLYWFFSVLEKPASGEIRIAQKIIAEQTQSSMRSVSRYLSELIAHGFVEALEKPVPGKVRPFKLIQQTHIPVQAKVEVEVEQCEDITTADLTWPTVPRRIPKEPIPEPIELPESHEEKQQRMLDAMAEAVVEQALKDPIPEGKEWPNSLESFLTFLYTTTPPTFLTTAASVIDKHKRGRRLAARAGI